MGRKKIEIDTAEVERLAGLGLTQEEICSSLSISVDTLERRVKDSADFAKGLSHGQAFFNKSKPINNELKSRQSALSLIKSGNGYSERHLSRAAVDIIDKISDLLGFPRAVRVNLEAILPNRVRCDILSINIDGSLTVYEVKRSFNNSSRSWGLYESIGQLLYYREVLFDCQKNPEIHMAIIWDYDPDEYFINALSRISSGIHYLNIYPLIKDSVA